MPVKIKVGHYYERRDGLIAGPAEQYKPWVPTYPYVWRVGVQVYTVSGEFVDGDKCKFDLVKDLGTEDPRKVVDTRKKPERVREPKKFRKVRMWFYRGEGEGLSVSEDRSEAKRWHYPGYAPIFSQIIEVPVTKKA